MLSTSYTVSTTGLSFGRITQKRPVKNVSGPTDLLSNFGWNSSKWAKKGDELFYEQFYENFQYILPKTLQN